MKILKDLQITLVVTFYMLLLTFISSGQGIGINAIGNAPDASAVLDLSSTNKGFLITRVDTANINSPAFGLLTLAPIDSCLYLFNGKSWMGMGGGGHDCSCNCSELSTPTPPSLYCGPDTITVIKDVINPKTGKTWMDRNLGASQVATSSIDEAAYGDLYQWGRCFDGHEKRTSGSTTTLSTADDPGHSDFIIVNGSPGDWRSPQNDGLWQGAAGINNPCPAGYRIPTEVELETERQSWATNNAAGAFASPLKFTLAGRRNSNSGLLETAGTEGRYRSSSISTATPISTTFARELAFVAGNALIVNNPRAQAVSIRCIKD